MAETQKARKAEAQDNEEVVEFEHDGVTYTVERGAIDNLELFEYVEDAQYIKATRGFIGQEQWDRFKDHYRDEKGRVPLAHLEGFLDALMKAVGQGN